jgi:Mce-associated membrane protein
VIGLTRGTRQAKEDEALADVVMLPGADAGSEPATATDESVAAPATDSAAATESEAAAGATARGPTRVALRRVLVFGLLPGLAMLLAVGVGYLKYQKNMLSETQTARIESVQASTDSTIKILSYNPDTVDRDLGAARDRLTGTFLEAYTHLTHDIVIPGAKQHKVSAVASVPAAASISATPNHAVVMVFVNQTITEGSNPPSSTASTVRVTMDKRDDRWLISDFTPI